MIQNPTRRMPSPTCRFVGRQSRLALRTPSYKLSGLPLQPRFYASSLAALATQVNGDSLHSHASPTPQNDILRTLALRLTHRQLLPRVIVLDPLRAHYPSHRIICTGKETGLLKLARAGRATATIDTDAPFYAQRYYKPPSTERSDGQLKRPRRPRAMDIQGAGSRLPHLRHPVLDQRVREARRSLPHPAPQPRRAHNQKR